MISHFLVAQVRKRNTEFYRFHVLTTGSIQTSAETKHFLELTRAEIYHVNHCLKNLAEKYPQPQLCERPRGAAHVDWAIQSLRRLREPGLGGACATGLGAVALGTRNPAPLPWGNASKEGA